MRIPKRLAAILLTLGALALSACGPTYENGPPAPSPEEIAALERAILDLGEDVDRDEAEEAARIAYFYPLELAESYGITDAPIVHNMKVNRGLRPRGLCWHWADDLERRLRQEGFTSFDLHRAIAGHDKPLEIEHSTVILSRAGQTMEEGIVLDPWRWGGRLYWGTVPDDPEYDWAPRAEVFAMRAGWAREKGAEPIPAEQLAAAR